MFARTERLMLRPAWPEDAPALAAAIRHEQVAPMLRRVPHPYTSTDAETWATTPCGPYEPRFVIETLERGPPVLIGGIGIGDGSNLGFWLAPSAWGRGYATEAGRAVVEMAKHSLALPMLKASHVADDPASGRVLQKLGFRPTGTVGSMHSRGRTAAPGVDYVLDLDARCEPLPIAA